MDIQGLINDPRQAKNEKIHTPVYPGYAAPTYYCGFQTKNEMNRLRNLPKKIPQSTVKTQKSQKTLFFSSLDPQQGVKGSNFFIPIYHVLYGFIMPFDITNRLGWFLSLNMLKKFHKVGGISAIKEQFHYGKLVPSDGIWIF